MKEENKKHKLARFFYYTSIISYCCSFILFVIVCWLYVKTGVSYNQFPFIECFFGIGVISAAILNITSLHQHLNKPREDMDREQIKQFIHDMLD